MPTVAARARKVTLDAREGLAWWLGGLDGLDLIYGQASVEDAKTVIVQGESYPAPQIFTNVGARPQVPKVPGLKNILLVVFFCISVECRLTAMWQHRGSHSISAICCPVARCHVHHDRGPQWASIAHQGGVEVAPSAHCKRNQEPSRPPVFGPSCNAAQPGQVF
jgi:hypothetical protein